MTRLSGNYLLNSRAISNINQCSSKVKTTYFVWWTSVNLHPVPVKMSKQNKLPYGSILVPKNNWRLTWACITHLSLLYSPNYSSIKSRFSEKTILFISHRNRTFGALIPHSSWNTAKVGVKHQSINLKHQICCHSEIGIFQRN
jgi:hypothetical protein